MPGLWMRRLVLIAGGLVLLLGLPLLGLGQVGRTPAAAQSPSPMLREAYRLAATWDGNVQQGAPGSLLDPAGMALGKDAIYIVDRGNDRLAKFDLQMGFLKVWGQRGAGPAEFNAPQDVAVDGDRVYVTDRGNGRVAVVSTDGTPVSTISVTNLAQPWGIAASGGRVYVSEPEQGQVVVLENGAVVARWSGLKAPYGIAVGPDGRVYVADRGAGAVGIYSRDGVLQSSIVLQNPDFAPLDVAVDETGDVYIQAAGAILWYPVGATSSRLAMYYNGLRSVVVNSRGGVFATAVNDARLFHGVVNYRWRPSVGVPQREWPLLSFPPGRLNQPNAIVAGSDGRIWVADAWPRAQAFRPDGSMDVTVNQSIRPVDLAVGPTGTLLVGEMRRLMRLVPPYTGISNTLRLAQGTTDYWLTALALQDGGRRVSMLDSALGYVREFGVATTMSLAVSWTLAFTNPWQLYWDLAAPPSTPGPTPGPNATPTPWGNPNPSDRVYAVNRTARRIEVYAGRKQVAGWAVEGIPVRVAVGPDGSVFVLSLDGIVTKFGPDGTPVAGWDAGAFSAGGSEVVDLTVDAAGRVLTLDRRANTVRVWERDPQGTPEAPIAGGGACRLRGDKRAAPATLRIGGQVTVTLEVGGECPNTAPRSDIILAIDKSGSMNANNQMTATRAAALQFIDAIDLTQDRVGIVAFDNTPRLLQPLTGDRNAARSAVAGIAALGGTNIAGAIKTAATELLTNGRPGASPVVILLTDGRDEDPDKVLVEASAAKARGVRLFTIAFGDVDPMIMVLSASSPEEYYYAPDPTTLSAIYAEIARRLSATVLARTLTVVDVLPADMTFVPGSDVPRAVWDAATRTLTWTLTNVPFSGVSLRYRVQPQALGRHATNVEAKATFKDGLDREGRLRFPVPEVELIREVPTATLTPTPFPTPTSRPTATDVPPEPVPLYLPILLWQRCKDQTIHADVAVVMDTSGSMNEAAGEAGGTKLQAAIGAARLFVEALQLPDDRAAVVSFNEEALLVQELTGDRDLLLARLSALQTKTGTRIDLGLEVALAELTGARSVPANNRVIVLLTDGRVTGADNAMVVIVADRVKAAGIRVFTIGLGTDLDVDLLRQVATRPEDFFSALSASDLAGIYGQIAYTLQCVNLTWP